MEVRTAYGSKDSIWKLRTAYGSKNSGGERAYSTQRRSPDPVWTIIKDTWRNNKMDMIEAIETRRSIRRYNDTPVTKEEIEKIVAEAAWAPTWKNTQTSRYIAVMDEELKQRIGEECCLGFAGNTGNIKGAGALVVLTTVNGRSGYEKDGSYSTSKGEHWQSFDAGIACQTFCLAAHAMGLGTVIMGIYDEEKVKEMLMIPEEQSVSALIALGHYEEEPKATPRKCVEELLHFQ